MTNATAVEALGYEVTATTPTVRFSPSYELRGARGAHYGLIRCNGESRILCAISLRTGRVAEVRGYTHFTDRDGILRPWR